MPTDAFVIDVLYSIVSITVTKLLHIVQLNARYVHWDLRYCTAPCVHSSQISSTFSRIPPDISAMWFVFFFYLSLCRLLCSFIRLIRIA
ncbi:hypothetical protein QCA50_002564 [Cerrena zonata]|uniref:Uncharacterized protein n=1 Tax=Cerrena zonata TaxID=2478898 RepID=A0AAW0GMF3_9APHY